MTQPRHTADSITDDDLDQLYARLAEAELKAEAMTAAMQSTATDALKHRGCHMKLMAQCARAERAEAALNAMRAELDAIRIEVGSHRGKGDPETLGYRLGLAGAERQLRAALDTHTTPTETR